MFRFILIGVMIGASLFSAPSWGTNNSLVKDAGWFIAKWENRPLALGEVDYVDGHFPGDNARASAQACAKRPECREGAAIGFGYSLAGHSKADVRRDLTSIIGQKRTEAMIPCVGLVAMAAYTKCHGNEALRLTRGEAFALLEGVRIPRDIQAVRSKAKDEGVALNRPQMVAMVSLYYTGPGLVKKAPKLWRAIKTNEVADAVFEVEQNSGTQYVPGLMKRRRAEAALLLQGP